MFSFSRFCLFFFFFELFFFFRSHLRATTRRISNTRTTTFIRFLQIWIFVQVPQTRNNIRSPNRQLSPLAFANLERSFSVFEFHRNTVKATIISSQRVPMLKKVLIWILDSQSYRPNTSRTEGKKF